MAENLLPELVSRLNATIPTISKDYEIILVEDGSPDNSWSVIKEICKKPYMDCNDTSSPFVLVDSGYIFEYS